MAHKWKRSLLLYFTSLALLPGCQHLPSFRIGKEPVEILEVYPEKPGPQNASTDAVRITAQNEQKTSAALPSTAVLPVDLVVKRENPFPDLPNRSDRIQVGQSAEEKKPSPSEKLNANKKSNPSGIAGIVEPVEHQVAAFQGNPPALPVIPTPELTTAENREYAPLVKALQCILDEHHQEAIQHLKAYDAETQEFFLRWLPPLTILVRKHLSELTPPEAAVLSDALANLLRELRPRSELCINKMCYCKRIRGFGNYEPLQDNHTFLAGSNNRPGEVVQLYVELKNFANEPTADAHYQTKLACSLELRDATKIVWSYRYDPKETTQRRKSRLNDLHGNYSFYVPALPPGAYKLVLQIADETTPELRPRIARRELEFRVSPVAGNISQP